MCCTISTGLEICRLQVASRKSSINIQVSGASILEHESHLPCQYISTLIYPQHEVLLLVMPGPRSPEAGSHVWFSSRARANFFSHTLVFVSSLLKYQDTEAQRSCKA